MVRCGECGRKIKATGATKTGERIGARVQRLFEYRCRCGATIWAEEIDPDELQRL
jgi:hypothetical protein